MVKVFNKSCPMCGAKEGELHKYECGLAYPTSSDKPKPSSTITITLPAEMAGTEAEVKSFIDAMIYKLAKNAHKGKWETTDLKKARQLLNGEIEELDDAIESKSNTVEILLEAADVANFALILATVAIRDAGK